MLTALIISLWVIAQQIVAADYRAFQRDRYMYELEQGTNIPYQLITWAALLYFIWGIIYVIYLGLKYGFRYLFGTL